MPPPPGTACDTLPPPSAQACLLTFETASRLEDAKSPLIRSLPRVRACQSARLASLEATGGTARRFWHWDCIVWFTSSIERGQTKPERCDL